MSSDSVCGFLENGLTLKAISRELPYLLSTIRTTSQGELVCLLSRSFDWVFSIALRRKSALSALLRARKTSPVTFCVTFYCPSLTRIGFLMSEVTITAELTAGSLGSRSCSTRTAYHTALVLRVTPLLQTTTLQL